MPNTIKLTMFLIQLSVLIFFSMLIENQVSGEEVEQRDTVFEVNLRSRGKSNDAAGPKFEQQSWPARKTAVIVCDMWDSHHCYNAVQRVGEIGPRMNEVISFAREKGATIIHAPSSCVGHYSGHPARKRVASIPKSKNVPDQIDAWCHQIDAESADEYPIDQSDGGEDDDLEEHARWAEKLSSLGLNPRAPWRKQVDLISIEDQDFISDKGVEIWNILENREVENVILVGVHTNMCVLGRPFGLRQMAKNGKNVVLMRDMTDTMYNPNSWPYVSHFQGTDLIVRHIEKNVCPTITSDQLIGGKPFRFKNDVRPKAVVAIAETLYDTKETLAAFSEDVIRDQLGFEITVLHGDENRIDGLAEALADADVLIVSVRRSALPGQDLQAIRDHISAGKPIVAIRTASHAFDTRGKHPNGHAEWTDFDSQILGADYSGHFANELKTDVSIVAAAKSHPILTGVKSFRSDGSLYQSKIVSENATLILNGTVNLKGTVKPNSGDKPKDQSGDTVQNPTQPVAWTNTLKTAAGEGRVFYTSLGHPNDFADPNFRRLLENGFRWATEMKIGQRPQIRMK